MCEKSNEYWHCIIGPTKRANLPWGADYPLRQAVEQAFADVVGDFAEHAWTGWGCSDYVREAIQYASFHPQEIHALIAKRNSKLR